LYHLHLGTENHLPSAIRLPYVVCPFHSSLVKYGRRVTAFKKQYKLVSWFDLGMVEHPFDLLRGVESQFTLTNFPVFLLSYADILELTEPLTDLMRGLPHCTFLFIPSNKIKQVVTKLLKIQEEAQGKKKPTEQTVYQFLLSTIGMLQAEQGVPIAIFNPPRDVS